MENNPKINIILSTYNGEKYIKEQLESLFNQNYSNIKIYVRDDGSTDKTVEILEGYERIGRINLIKGDNIGFCASFIELLDYVNEGEYWSFCDQDDIWYPDKIEYAVKWLSTQKQDIPLLYYSLSKMINEKGEVLGIQKPPKGSLIFRRAMTGTFGVGFSMVINAKLREEMLKCNPEKVHSHDWLAGAIALGFGRVYVDKRISAIYRRLENSVTKISAKKRILWTVSMLKNNGDVRDRNMEYYRVFKNDLSIFKAKTASLFGEENISLRNSILKALYPHRWRPNIGSEIVMRILMLIRKV